MYSINFTKNYTEFCLSLHCNGENSYLFVNGTEIHKFKVKDSEIVPNILSACSCHVTYTCHSESTFYICLNVKELLARSKCKIWSLSGCNWTRTHNHLVHKWTLNHLDVLNGSVFVYKLSGCEFESSSKHFVLRKSFKFFLANNVIKTGLNGYVYDFSADYGAFAVDDILNIHKYFMKKNNIV